jgi:hypothetical protein
MKTYRGRRGITPLILNLSLDGSEWLTSHLGHFTPRKEPQYPLNRRLVDRGAGQDIQEVRISLAPIEI